MSSWISWTVSEYFFCDYNFFLSLRVFVSVFRGFLSWVTDKILIFFYEVNGHQANGQTDAKPTGQAEAGEAEDDSDDEKDEGGAAAEGAGTSGGVFAMYK